MTVLTAPQVRSHVPLLGRETGVQLALLPKGVRIKPVDQILYVGGFLGTYKIVTVTATSSYVLLIGSNTYTVVAGTADTPKSVAYKLIDLVNAETSIHGCTAQNPRLVSGDDWILDVYHPTTTFTLAKTGTTTTGDVTVVATAGNTTAIAKSATSIAILNALEGAIQKDQYLQALDNNGIEYLIKLTATAAVGATSLSVAALDEGIPAGSQIGFPVEFFDRTDADTNEKIDKADFLTFNTAGRTDGVATKITAEGKLGGLFYERCPSYNTAAFASSNGREVWLVISDPVYRDGWNRRKIEGPALILSRDKARKADGFITNDMSYQFLGAPTETPAAPLY
jgi:hypothetical protein